MHAHSHVHVHVRMHTHTHLCMYIHVHHPPTPNQDYHSEGSLWLTSSERHILYESHSYLTGGPQALVSRLWETTWLPMTTESEETHSVAFGCDEGGENSPFSKGLCWVGYWYYHPQSPHQIGVHIREKETEAFSRLCGVTSECQSESQGVCGLWGHLPQETRLFPAVPCPTCY